MELNNIVRLKDVIIDIGCLIFVVDATLELSTNS